MYFYECTKPNLKKPILQLSAYCAKSEIFMFRESFRDKQTLYLVLGHEILHAAYYSLGKNTKERQELSCRYWMKNKAKEMNYYNLNGLNKNYIDYINDYPNFDRYKYPQNIKFKSDGKNW